jgi:hypothetical protein
MNHKLNEALFKQRIRKIHRQVVTEARLLNEEESLYSVFVQPFVDVVDAAKLSGQDILNVASLYFDLLVTLDPRKMKKAMEEFDKNKATLDKKWEPILERNREALASGDADLIAMVLAPGYFVASEAGLRVWGAVPDIYGYLGETGWRLPFAAAIMGGKPEAPPKDKDKGGKEKGILDKLKDLFYLGEGIVLSSDNIILEQDAPDEQKPSLEKAFQEYLEQTGLDQDLEDTGKELVDLYKTLLSDIADPLLAKFQVAADLAAAVDSEQFMAALESASKQGIDLETAGLDTVLSQIKQDAEKLAQSEEFRKKIAGVKTKTEADEATESPPQVTDQEALKAAEKVVFVKAKQKFDEKYEQMQAKKEKIKQQVLQALNEKLPNESSVKALKTTEAGREFLEQIITTKQKIKDA